MPPLSSLSPPATLLRNIASELRKAMPGGYRLQGSPSMTFLVSQFRKHEVTQEQHCKHQEEMAFLADTYHTYLGSQRRWRAVQQEYHAAGERSVQNTAHLVGLNMPNEPKVIPKKEKAMKEMKPAGYHPRYD